MVLTGSLGEMVYLEIVLGIPVRVEDDYCVCCSEIDSETSSSSTEKEDEAVRIWKMERVRYDLRDR